jgi:hypothetical protein
VKGISVDSASTEGQKSNRRTFNVTRIAEADTQVVMEETGLNVTDVLNRAVRVYRAVLDAESRGGGLYDVDPVTKERVRVRFL